MTELRGIGPQNSPMQPLARSRRARASSPRPRTDESTFDATRWCANTPIVNTRVRVSCGCRRTNGSPKYHLGCADRNQGCGGRKRPSAGPPRLRCDQGLTRHPFSHAVALMRVHGRFLRLFHSTSWPGPVKHRRPAQLAIDQTNDGGLATTFSGRRSVTTTCRLREFSERRAKIQSIVPGCRSRKRRFHERGHLAVTALLLAGRRPLEP
jgi:hypothetical protein